MTHTTGSPGSHDGHSKSALFSSSILLNTLWLPACPKNSIIFFRACTNPNPRLCTFAITNLLSCIQCIYIPSVICKEEYIIALCSLRSKCNTLARRRALLQGNVLLRLYKLEFRAIPSWRNIACLSKHHTIIPQYIQNLQNCSLHNLATRDEDKQQEFIITCCKCNSQFSVS